MSRDLVGVWHVPLSDGLHTVEFEHGTATGKRIVRLNNEEIFRKDWMFKLVGEQEFKINSTPCAIRIEPVSGFSYQYSLVVNGKLLSDFTKQRSNTVCTWVIDEKHRIVLEKDTLDIWVDGQKVEATGEFVDGGTETHFTIGEDPAFIKAISSANKREGLIYNLFYGERLIQQETEEIYS